MHHVRYFLAVCDTLNFTRAAEACNVTQPALSRAIQQLEAEVGGLLFRREGRQTHMTDLGRLIRPRLQEVHRDAEEAKTAARRFLTLDAAEVTLGVMCTIGPRRFAAFLADFQSRSPGVEIKVLDATAEELTHRLEAGDIDLAVMASSQALPERFESRTLYRERFTVAFPAGHRFERLHAVPLREISSENYLSRIHCEYAGHIDAVCAEQGFEIRVVHASEREDWILNMVAAGLGVCFLPENSALGSGVLTRPVIEPEVVREVSAIHVAGRRFSPAVGRFRQALLAASWG